MVNDIAKTAVDFALLVGKNAISAVAIIVSILLILFVLQISTDVLIVIAKAFIDFLQYVATTLL
jgi:hypothetical protein